MSNEGMRNYIANLPIGAARTPLEPEEETGVKGVDINNLPNGIVTGSNLLQFPKDATPQIKSSVALSLLAAQRVATNDPVVMTPQQWIDRHNTVLKNLNWQIAGGGFVDSEFDSVNVAMHKAIIPFLTAAFGGAVAASALIIVALNQLQDMDKNSPWITLFDRESRRFDVTEYQFSVVEVAGDQVTLRLACARFDASFGRTQVIFVKVTQEHAHFNSATQTLSTNANLLVEMNDGLKAKLAGFTAAYIQNLPV
jgi:hypothetical protein